MIFGNRRIRKRIGNIGGNKKTLKLAYFKLKAEIMRCGFPSFLVEFFFCSIAKMNSSYQSSPVSPILEPTAKPAINSKIKLILKDYPGASGLSFEMNSSL